MRHTMLVRRVSLLGAMALLPSLLSAPGLAGFGQAWAATRSAPSAGQIARVSRACPGPSAEVQTAVDPHSGIAYEEWIGCGGIGFARTTDGGRTFSRAFELPGSGAGWDPAIAIAPDGTVYAAFMVARDTRLYPVVDISDDHGLTFPKVRSLVPARRHNWGDRDFIAVGPHGAIYVTWDYGPHNLSAADFVCSPTGSCSFIAGDLNVVLQKSTDGGRTWSKITPISPGFPGSGADSAPILVEPSGRLDVLYQGYQVLNRSTLRLGVAHQFFTASTNYGRSWSRPVRVGPSWKWMNTTEWWIDGAFGIDSGGDLYATWDTQSGGHDIGWLAYSTSHGRTWSRLVRVTPDRDSAMHLVQVAGGSRGIAYVGWLTDGPARGYAQYLRVFSVRKGWLTRTFMVSVRYGNRNVWPGDTIGLSLYPPGAPGDQQVLVSWGSGIGSGRPASQIWARMVSHLP